MRDITVRWVKALDDFKLDLTFSDGERKIYDMKPQIWGVAFEPMKGNMDFSARLSCGWGLSHGLKTLTSPPRNFTKTECLRLHIPV